LTVDEEIASSENENTIKIGTGAHANTLLLTGDSDSIEKDEDGDESSTIFINNIIITYFVRIN
jgi:hypothetical protein